MADEVTPGTNINIAWGNLEKKDVAALIGATPPAEALATYPVSGLTNGTFRFNAGYSAPGQSAKTFVGKVALSGAAITTVTLETVTALKLFVITDIFISADAGQVMDVRLQAAGVDIFRAPCKGDTAPVSLAGIETQPTATAGQLVTLVFPITTNPNGYFYIAGFEQ